VTADSDGNTKFYIKRPSAFETAAFANALGALVASLPGATPLWSVADCRRLISEHGTSQDELPPNYIVNPTD
jgi:hypothetical protein